MSIKRILPREAHDLLAQGYAYLDVRSIPEYQAGHPPGAYNAPLLHFSDGRMVPNPDFAEVVERVFPKDAKLVVGCKVGGRSLRAATLLAERGYSDVIDCRGGFVGEYDHDGILTVPGWSKEGLPVSTTPEPGRTWRELSGE